jgi:peptidoglycan/LPS O-acetylase OafA/YrhL
MGTSQGPLPAGGQRTLTALGYVLLFVLGALQGLIGSFQYSQSPSPVIAILLAVIIFATCAGCGWGLGTFGGALVPAVGWILATFILAMSRPEGSVVITATTAGECYLYGGALACAVGCLAGFFARVRRPLPRR